MTEPLDLDAVERMHAEACGASRAFDSVLAELRECRAELAEYRHDSYRCAHLTRVEKAQAAIARAEALHRRIPDRFPDRNPDVCEQCLEPYSGCHEPWPCPTMRALRGTND